MRNATIYKFALLYFLLSPVTGVLAQGDSFDLLLIEKQRILGKASAYTSEKPVTVTAHRAVRSAGGIHDFYSEGDYWWPDPDDPRAPYVRRDGLSNPDNFVAHRRAMIRFSEITATLVSAFILTGESTYSDLALEHLDAWFINENTRMNPSLLYGQAIQGRASGRSIGIIDTIHLVEVARSVQVLEHKNALPSKKLADIKDWFATYLDWLQTHPYGQRERVHPNNHGVCWSMQAAAFADLVGQSEVLSWVGNQFKTVYLEEMMDLDGSFPAELSRTKPYGYSLFVLDAMSTVAQIVSTQDDDLWTYQLPDGRGLKKGVAFLFPYMQDKNAWPYPEDVLYWNDWPVRQPSLLFAGLRYGESKYLKLWESLEADPAVAEIVRNLPVRHPLLWMNSGE